MKVIPFPVTRIQPRQRLEFTLALECSRDYLESYDVDPATIRSLAELDALLERLDAETDARVRALPSNDPVRMICEALDRWMQDRDDQAFERTIAVAGRRNRLQVVRG